jgi:copper chaperone CopZ/predicted peroxiredoxin
MSKTVSYLVVGVVAFLGGSFSVLLADYAGATNTQSKAGPSQASNDRAGHAPSREFSIEGMACQGCVDAITDVLTKIPGVKSATVSLEDKRAIVTAAPADVPTEKILAAIAAAGYKGRLAPATEHPAANAANAAGHKPAILVNVTRGTDQLHAAAMAMALAQSALKDGRSATIFLNVQAPAYAAKDLDPHLKCDGFPPFKKMLADFIAGGGRLMVCQHCAHLAKVKPDAMIAGAKPVAQNELLDALLPGTVVFSY